MSTVAGLPKYVSLKSKSNGKYLHCISDGKSFMPDVKFGMGCLRDLDADDLLVRLEVVPSASEPTRLIHLRCSYNNKFLQPESGVNMLWIWAGADAPDEDRTRYTSTLFQPVFLPGHERNTVGLVHVQTNNHLKIVDYTRGWEDSLAFIHGREGLHMFEFAAWDSNVKDTIINTTDREIQRLKSSYEEKLKVKDGEIQRLKSTNAVNVKAKDGEIQKLKSANVVNMKSKDGEIQQLKSSYEEKMKVKDEEILKLKKSGAGEGPDGIVGELRMEIAELKLQLDDAWKEIEELKAAAAS